MNNLHTLAQALAIRGFTQREVAEELNLMQMTLSFVESGKTFPYRHT